jgi:hypothetical protein
MCMIVSHTDTTTATLLEQTPTIIVTIEIMIPQRYIHLEHKITG